jgi:hypothetical protein
MDVDKIAFTGSSAGKHARIKQKGLRMCSDHIRYCSVGKHIASCAAKSNLKTVTLELGGKVSPYRCRLLALPLTITPLRRYSRPTSFSPLLTSKLPLDGALLVYSKQLGNLVS